MMGCGDDGMGRDGNGFAWYGMVGGMGFSFFLFVLHDTLFALRLRYTIEAVYVAGLSLISISLLLVPYVCMIIYSCFIASASPSE
jgi:hypothetical protein